jgi:hypothetical protein
VILVKSRIAFCAAARQCGAAKRRLLARSQVANGAVDDVQQSPSPAQTVDSGDYDLALFAGADEALAEASQIGVETGGGENPHSQGVAQPAACFGSSVGARSHR